MPIGTSWIVVDSELQVRGDWRGEVQFIPAGNSGQPGRWVATPSTVELRRQRASEPELYVRVEVSSTGAQVTELRFKGGDQARGIRQSDLRNVHLDEMVEDLISALTRELDPSAGNPQQWLSALGRVSKPEVLRMARLLRRGRQRELRPELLQQVAAVYRNNIAGAPTKAVEQEFQVSRRMATEYVTRARQRGYLPPTTQGKKQA